MRTWPCLVLVAVLAVAGCGDAGRPDTQPTSEGSEFTGGAFDDIPRYPRSEEAGERTEQGDVVAQSFRARGATPEQVLEWYRDNLQGWRVDEPPKQVGTGTYRGRWVRDDTFLVVSASAAPTLPDEPASPETNVQYSLVLEPRR